MSDDRVSATSSSLFATGIYGTVKVVATAISCSSGSTDEAESQVLLAARLHGDHDVHHWGCLSHAPARFKRLRYPGFHRHGRDDVSLCHQLFDLGTYPWVYIGEVR